MYGLHGARCSFQGSWYMHVISTGWLSLPFSCLGHGNSLSPCVCFLGWLSLLFSCVGLSFFLSPCLCFLGWLSLLFSCVALSFFLFPCLCFLGWLSLLFSCLGLSFFLSPCLCFLGWLSLPGFFSKSIQIGVALWKFHCVCPDSTVSKLWTRVKSANTRTLQFDSIKMADDHDFK